MELSDNDILNRWNDVMKRAISNAREMVEHSSLGDKKRSMWNQVAHGLDELSRRGNIMAQGKPLSVDELGTQIDAWQFRIARKADDKAKKEKAKKDRKRIILDG